MCSNHDCMHLHETFFFLSFLFKCMHTAGRSRLRASSGVEAQLPLRFMTTSLTPHPLMACYSVFQACCNVTLVHFSFIPCASGGKDSCYNMMQCVAAGHRIVALANLRPADTGDHRVTQAGFTWSAEGRRSNIGQPRALLRGNKR